jgi:mono/diheme cytochrome c family protein
MLHTRLTSALALVLIAGGTTLAAENRLDSRMMFPSGQVAYGQVCARCHSSSEHAVGPDLTANPYDVEVLRFFVRYGSGPMPAFSESMIDNTTLDEIAAYLAAEYEETPQ